MEWVHYKLQSPVRLTTLAALFDEFVKNLTTEQDYHPMHTTTAANLWLVCSLFEKATEETISERQMECIRVTKAKALLLLELLDLYGETPLEKLLFMEGCLQVATQTEEEGSRGLSWSFQTDLTIDLDKTGLLEEEGKLMHMANTPIPTHVDQNLTNTTSASQLSRKHQQWNKIQTKIRILWEF
jgi:hypothetical protein